MHLYLGTSLPEIVKLEQVQRVAANAIKSCSELGGEVERAKPARLAKRGGWGGGWSCPQASQEHRHQGDGEGYLRGAPTAKEAEKIVRNS